MNKIHSIEINRKLVSYKRKSPTSPREYTLIVEHNGVQKWIPEISRRKSIHKQNLKSPVPANIYVYIFEKDEKQSHNDVALPVQWNLKTWLGYILEQWATQEINIKFISSDYALIKTKLLAKLDIFKSIEHNWQIILASDGKEFANISVIDELLKSPVNCVEVYPYELDSTEINYRVLEAVKNLVDLRQLRGQNLPSVICKLMPEKSNNIETTEALKQKVQQSGVDELILLDDYESVEQSEENAIWDL